jgi:hypothetical protein
MLKNERHGDVVRAIHRKMAQNLKTLDLKPFAVIWVSNINFLLPMLLVKTVW